LIEVWTDSRSARVESVSIILLESLEGREGREGKGFCSSGFEGRHRGNSDDLDGDSSYFSVTESVVRGVVES